VVSFGDFSTELCGGTHVSNTGDIGTLKVVSETGVAAGVRRIEALTGRGALAYLYEQDRLLGKITSRLKINRAALLGRVEKILEEKRELETELKQLRKAAQGAASADLAQSATEINGVRVIVTRVEAADRKALRPMVDELRNKLGSGIVLLACVEDGRVALALGVTPDLTKRFKAGALVAEVAKEVGGKGGGRPDFAQAGGQDPSKLDAAFAKFRSLVEAEGTA